MRRDFSWPLLVGVLSLIAIQNVARAEEPDGRAQAEAAVRQATADFVAAFNKGDEKAMAAFWSADGDYVGHLGSKIKFREHLAARASEAPSTDKPNGDSLAVDERPTLSLTITDVRVVKPDVALVDGLSLMRHGADSPAEHGRFAAVWVKSDKKWVMESVREAPLSDGFHHAHLLELKWLVGDWQEAGKEPRAQTSISYSKDGNYLIREFSNNLPGRGVRMGVQRIGWDAKAKKFRSWTFFSDGAYATGIWEDYGNRWVGESTGVTSDGKPVAFTNEFTKLDDNSIEWQSVDVMIDGQAQPDVKLKLVRKPTAKK